MDASPVSRDPGPRWRWILGGAAGIAAVLVLWFALSAWVRNENGKAVSAWQGRLTAMADDRQLAIEAWLAERRGDAQVIAAMPLVQALLVTDPAPARDGVDGVLRNILGAYGYDGGYVLSENGRVVASSPGAPELEPGILRWVLRRDRAHPADFLFLPRESPEKSLIAFSRPVVLAAAGPDAAPAGFVVLTALPKRFLYPLLARESLFTETGETFLVEREGGSLVFLSPLRHGDGGAFPLKLPLDTPDLAAARALKEPHAFGEFRDHRGERVLAAVRRIRGTDLGLVVKVDRREALASARRTMTLQGLVLVAVLFMLTGVGFGLWRHQREAKVQAVLRERQRSESRIVQLNRLLGTIYEINQLLVKERSGERLLSEACRILVEQGHFVLAWVGLAGEDFRVRPAAASGPARKYLDGIVIRSDDTEEGRGPTGTAIRDGRHVLNPDVAVNPAMIPWRERALMAGCRCSAAFPLRVGGRVAGALTVHAAEVGAIGDEEVALLDKLADDLGFALDALRAHEEKVKAEEALRGSEELWKAIVQNEPECVKIVDREGRLVEMNPAGLAMIQATAEQAFGGKVTNLVAPEDRDAFEEMVAGVFRGETRYLAFDMIGLKGRRLTLETSSVPLRDASGSGEVRALLGVTRDITERRRAETEREALLEIMRALVVAPDLRSYLALVHECISRVIYAENFFAVLHDERTGAFELVYLVDRYDEAAPPTGLGRGLAAYVIRTGEAHNVDERTFEELRARGEVEEVGTPSPSWLGAPLRKGDRTTGAIAVQDYETPGRYTERDRFFLASVAAQVGVAIERKRDEDRLRRAAAVFSSSRDGFVITNGAGEIEEINRSFEAMTGYSRDEIVGRNMRSLRSERHGEEFYQRLWDDLGRSGTWQGEIWSRRKDGSLFPAWVSIGEVPDEQSRVAGYAAVFSDISALKITEEKLEHLAQHDPLTDLPNRLLLYSDLGHAIARMRRGGRSGAVLFLDLDRFKIVNDSLGHAAGDEILKATARLLRERLREGDLIARLGGDEFVVLLEDVGGVEAVACVARDLIDRLRQPFVLANGREIYIGLSIGISLFPADGDRPEVLIQNADAALYAAKEKGRNTFRFYSESLTIAATERLSLEAELRRGLALGQYVVDYQPIMNLSTGRMESVEALVRWRSPERGLVMPDSFIGVAEETGLIVPLGEEVLRRACGQMREWLDQGLPIERIAVNLSPRQFLHQDLDVRVAAVLAETGLAAAHLELEITETALLEHGPEVPARLAALKAIGVRLAIDDFGTGYSSLSRLGRFPIDTLKIDKSFVKHVPDDRAQREIVLTIISLARHLRLHLVAEGVENERQVAFLKGNGCESAQGYFSGAPVPAERIFEAVTRG